MKFFFGSDWLVSLFNLRPEYLFLVCSITLQLFYFIEEFPSLHRAHSIERIPYVVNVAQGLITNDYSTVPKGVIEAIYLLYPKEVKLRYNWQLRTWREQAKLDEIRQQADKVCYDFTELQAHKKCLSSILLARPMRSGEVVSYSPHRFAAKYSPVGYIGYITGALVGILSQASGLYIIYMALITNALLVTGVNFIALRIMPVLQWPTVFLLMLPSSLLCLRVVQPDGLLISLSLLLAALVLNAHKEKKRLSCFNLVSIFIVSLLIALSKNVYFLLSLVVITLPTVCFGSSRWKYIFSLLVVMASISTAVVWDILAAEKYFGLYLDGGHTAANFLEGRHGKGYDPMPKFVAQLIEKPFSVFLVATNNITSVDGIKSLVLNLFFWNKYVHPSPRELADTPFWYIMALLGAPLLFAAIGKIPEKSFFTCSSKFFFAIAVFLTSILIIIANFTVFGYKTTPDEIIIGGVQGRYFLPLCIFFMAVIHHSVCVGKKNQKLFPIALHIYLWSTLAYTHVTYHFLKA